MSSFQPVIIIGAARSGTNMLRDVLTRFPGVATWPCDEINYIWRHGNARHPTDEFTRQMATPAVVRYIRRAFRQLARKTAASIIVEKTCANSLRVPFVDAVVPEAKYILILRDGRDVVASALKCWGSGLDLTYASKKARFVPLTDLPYYALKQLWNRSYRLMSRERRAAFWGPVFEGMEEMLRTKTLAEVCAVQWLRCVEESTAQLGRLRDDRVFKVQYERFVFAPPRELARLLRFLDFESEEEAIQKAVADVNTHSVGKYRKELDAETIRLVEHVAGSMLRRYTHT